jgi:hypothetical protein
MHALKVTIYMISIIQWRIHTGFHTRGGKGICESLSISAILGAKSRDLEKFCKTPSPSLSPPPDLIKNYQLFINCERLWTAGYLSYFSLLPTSRSYTSVADPEISKRIPYIVCTGDYNRPDCSF